MLVQALDGKETTADSLHGSFPDLMSAAGFRQVREMKAVATALGVVRIWRASLAASAPHQDSATNSRGEMGADSK